MAVGHELVLLALPELNRHADRVELEAPRGDEGEVVVDPSVDARTDAGAHVIEQKGGQRPSCHRAIGRTEQGLPDLGKLLRGRREQLVAQLLGRGSQRVLALEDRGELLHVLLAHPLEVVEPLRVVRCNGGQRGRSDHPVRQERGRGESMWASARDPPDAEPVDVERVADGDDVGGAVRDRPAFQARRATVTRAIVGEQADSALLRISRMRWVDRARPRRARDEENWKAGRIAALPNRERAPIRPHDRPHRASLLTGGSVLA